ncbi:putative reverse transcriptase domain-containing protein [Tanacetum coccineum]
MSSSSSFSSHATVTYTSVSSNSDLPPWGFHLMEAYEPEVAPQSPEQAPLSPVPAPDSPGYIVDSKPVEDDSEENPEMDPIDYPFDEQEEEPSASTDPASHVPDYVLSSEETEPFEADESAATQPPPISLHTACIAEYAAASTPPSPPPSPLSPLSSPLPMIPSSPLLLPSPTRRDIIPKAYMPLRKRARFTAPSKRFEIGESSAVAAARQPEPTLARGTELDFMTALEEVKESVADMATRQRQDSEEFYTRHQDAQDDRAFLRARISTLARERRYYHHMTCVADALADYEANRGSRNGHDSHDSGSGGRRHVPTARVCTYKDFLNCQPLNFKGTERVIGLTQWFEKMEYVFHISSCTVENQVKYATRTLLGNTLTWWNSHVKTIGHDAAYGMPWKTLMKMLTGKYCPRSEIKKLEIEIWNLKVKGTDVVSYTQCFQELALMCGRMFPEESYQVEKYVGGLLDMIQGNVMSARPKTMQEAIELANDLMDQKVYTFAERQAKNKRKLDSNPRDNQAQQQPFKSQNVARAYTAGLGEKKEYGGTLPLCTKCNYHHTRSCAAKCNNYKRVGHLACDCRSLVVAANT